MRFVPEKWTRTPFELGCNPSPPVMTPAFTSSALYFIMSSRSWRLGISPASEAFVALTRTMTFMGKSPALARLCALMDVGARLSRLSKMGTGNPIDAVRCLRQSAQFDHRPDFDGSLAGARNPARNLDRFVEMLGLDQEITAELLPRFGERSVGHRPLAVADAHAGRRRHGMQGRRTQELAVGVE